MGELSQIEVIVQSKNGSMVWVGEHLWTQWIPILNLYPNCRVKISNMVWVSGYRGDWGRSKGRPNPRPRLSFSFERCILRWRPAFSTKFISGSVCQQMFTSYIQNLTLVLHMNTKVAIFVFHISIIFVCLDGDGCATTNQNQPDQIWSSTVWVVESSFSFITDILIFGWILIISMRWVLSARQRMLEKIKGSLVGSLVGDTTAPWPVGKIYEAGLFHWFNPRFNLPGQML